MQLTELLIPTYVQMLGALAGWLDKAQEQLADEAEASLCARLAPDMFPLSTQVRFACVQAYEGVYRLTGEALPALLEALVDEGRNGGTHPGTLAEARERIDETLAFLAGLSPALLDASETSEVALVLPIGLTFDLTGIQYACARLGAGAVLLPRHDRLCDPAPSWRRLGQGGLCRAYVRVFAAGAWRRPIAYGRDAGGKPRIVSRRYGGAGPICGQEPALRWFLAACNPQVARLPWSELFRQFRHELE